MSITPNKTYLQTHLAVGLGQFAFFVHLLLLQLVQAACFALAAVLTGVFAITDVAAKSTAMMLKLIFFMMFFLN